MKVRPIQLAIVIALRSSSGSDLLRSLSLYFDAPLPHAGAAYVTPCRHASSRSFHVALPSVFPFVALASSGQ